MGVDNFAAALEVFTSIELLPRAEFYIARGRALLNYDLGTRDKVSMQRLSNLLDEAERGGLKRALAALDKALNYG